MPKLRYLFLVKICIMPIFGIALFGWAVGKANGFGPVFNKGTHITNGNPVAVVFFTAMSSAIAPKATLALNSESRRSFTLSSASLTPVVADFTRYAKSPRVVVWTNILSLTLYVTWDPFCPVLTAHAAAS
jgi:NCS1 family nucleobase:cation symporter-1